VKSRTIGVLARETGVKVATVRYYERRKLLAEPPRNAAGYRIYPDDAQQRVRFIRQAQSLGFSLGEIEELLSLRASRNGTCERVRRKAQNRISDIEEKISSLARMSNALRELADHCPTKGPLSKCPILNAIEKGN